MPKPNVESRQGDWFCQASEAVDTWDCVQNPHGMKSPFPTPFGKPTLPEPVPTSTLSSVDTTEAARLDPLQLPRDLADANRADAEVPTTVPVLPSGEGGEPAAEADGAPPEVAGDKPHMNGDVMPPKPALAREPNPSSAKQPDWQRFAYHPAVPVALGVLPAHFYAVQIVAMSSSEGLESFSNEHGLSGVPTVRVEADGKLYYVLLLGIYETLADASAAVASRPESLMTMQPWIRKLGSLQEGIARAENRGQIPVSSNISEN
jgi:septal ring-binding cell division protein DamX